jgi:hypothetical protein
MTALIAERFAELFAQCPEGKERQRKAAQKAMLRIWQDRRDGGAVCVCGGLHASSVAGDTLKAGATSLR